MSDTQQFFMGNYVTGKYTKYLAFMYLNKQLISHCCHWAKGNNAQKNLHITYLMK